MWLEPCLLHWTLVHTRCALNALHPVCARGFEHWCSSVERARLRQSADVSTSRDFFEPL